MYIKIKELRQYGCSVPVIFRHRDLDLVPDLVLNPNPQKAPGHPGLPTSVPKCQDFWQHVVSS